MSDRADRAGRAGRAGHRDTQGLSQVVSYAFNHSAEIASNLGAIALASRSALICEILTG